MMEIDSYGVEQKQPCHLVHPEQVAYMLCTTASDLYKDTGRNNIHTRLFGKVVFKI